MFFVLTMGRGSLCQKKPWKFSLDPLLIEKVYSEMCLVAKYFTKTEWPDLYKVIEKMNKLINDTSELRHAIVGFNRSQAD